MKSLLLMVAVLLVVLQSPNLGHPCAGALHAQSEEKRLPKGEWCQRPTPQMRKEAHACACHAHDCTKDPEDQNNRSAHTDAKCLSYCEVHACNCEKMDCP